MGRASLEMDDGQRVVFNSDADTIEFFKKKIEDHYQTIEEINQWLQILQSFKTDFD